MPEPILNLLKTLGLPTESGPLIGLLILVSILCGIIGVVFWTVVWPRMWTIMWHRWLLLKAPKRPLAPESMSLSELIPESNYLDVGGAKVHYVQGGEGPDIVLVHGIGASLFIWRFLFPLLQTQFRVTALDVPGFGKSSKEASRDYGLDSQVQTIDGAIQSLNLVDPILVGSSMGGAISLWLARTFPERYRRIVALAPAVDHALLPPRIKHLALGTPFLRRGLNRLTMKLILAQVLSRRELVTDATVEAYLSPFLDTGDSVRAFWKATTLLSDPRLPTGLTDLKAEVLVIYGERDGMIPRSSMDRLMRILPNARLMAHEHAGHHLMEDEPTWLAERLVEFAGGQSVQE